MKLRGICGILTAVVTFSCAVQPRSNSIATPKVPSYFDSDSLRAIYFYTEGVRLAAQESDKDEASKMFLRAVEIDSLFGPALYGLADANLYSSPDNALQYSLRANSTDSANVDYRSQLAYLNMLNGNYRPALESYNRLLVDDPRNPFNYKAVAVLYNAQGMPYTAIGILDSAEYKLGRIEDLVDYKRELLIKLKLYDRAIAETRSAIAENQFDSSNYRILAELYDITGSDSLSAAAYSTAMKIDSTNVETLFSLADFYLKHRRENEYLATVRSIFLNRSVKFETKEQLFDRITSDIEFYRRNFFAIGTLTSTIKTYYPDEYKATDLYASHLIRMGEPEKALEELKSFAASHDQLPPYYAIFDIESYLERPDSVQKYSELAIERFPRNSDLYLRKGYVLEKIKAPRREIERAYRKAIEYAADSLSKSSATGVLGDHYHSNGLHRAAFDTYRRALSLNPDNSVVLNNYAYYLSELGQQLPLALTMSERACTITPSNPTYIDTRAWILHLMGRNEEAKRLMQQAISLDSSGDATLLVHYGDILAALGENFMAKTYWERAQKSGYSSVLIEERIKKLEE